MKNQKAIILFSIILLGGLLLPLTSLAGGMYKADGTDVCYEGLVPCGKDVYIGGRWEEGKCIGGALAPIRCQFCHFFVMLDAIIDFVLIQLVPPVAILMLVIGGVMFMFAHFSDGAIPGGSPKLLLQAKTLMKTVIIGLAIIFIAWIIIDLFFALIGVAEWTGLQEGWFQIKCPILLE